MLLQFDSLRLSVNHPCRRLHWPSLCPEGRLVNNLRHWSASSSPALIIIAQHLTRFFGVCFYILLGQDKSLSRNLCALPPGQGWEAHILKDSYPPQLFANVMARELYLRSIRQAFGVGAGGGGGERSLQGAQKQAPWQLLLAVSIRPSHAGSVPRSQ